MSLTARSTAFRRLARLRLQLARALMCPSDLLLLDEPTNPWTWMRWCGSKPGSKYAGTMIVISHDREFLDAVTERHAANRRRQANAVTAAITASLKSCVPSKWAATGRLRHKQQDKMRTCRSSSTASRPKASKAKQAQSRVKALERMERVAPCWPRPSSPSSSREPVNLPNPCWPSAMLRLATRPTTAPKPFCKASTARFWPGSASASWVPTAGQVTLVKTIAREMAPLAGTFLVTEGKGLSIGYFAQQELDVLRPGENRWST